MKVLFVTGDLRDGDFLEHETKKVASNIQIEISPDARDAISRLDPSASYELVLIDAQLPNGECQALIDRIRQQNLPLPVVVIIGPNDEDPPSKFLVGGADDYIVRRPNYVSRVPVLLQQAFERYRGRVQRRARTIRVLYAGDMESARRHLGSVPFIELEAAVVNEDGTVHRPTGAHPTSLACDLVVLEDQALGVHVLKVLKDVTSRWPDYPVVLFLATGQEDMAIQALRLGAADCIIKNGDYYERFLLSLDGLIARREMMREKMALRASEERLRMIIEFVPACVALLASDGTFLALNWAGLSLVGARHVDDIVGKNLFALVGPPQDEQLRAYVSRICGGERDSIRVKWGGLDGLPRELELRAVPLRRDPNGTTVALVVVQDVSHVASGEELKDLQERCEQLGRALKETETAKQEVADQKRAAEEALATAEVKLAEAAARQEGERAQWESLLEESGRKEHETAEKVRAAEDALKAAEERLDQAAARQAAERMGLESTLKGLEQQLQSADEHRIMLEEALLAAKSRCTEMADGHQAEMSQLQSRMAEIERKAQAARDEKNTLEEILHELEGKHEEFVVALRAEKTQVEAARDELMQRLAAAEGQHMAFSDELTAAREREAELTSLRESERSQWQMMRQELEESRSGAEAQAAFMNDLLRAAEERYGALKENFNAESARWEAARLESDRQQSELVAQRNALDAEKQAAHQRLNEALAATENERSRIEAERQDLERQRQAADEQINRLAEELHAAEARLAEGAAALQGERSVWEAARADLEQRINAAGSQVTTLEEAVRSAQRRQDEQSVSHQADQARWEKERSELESRLRSAEGEREALRELSRTVQLQLDQVVAGFETERTHWLTARQQLESRCQGLEELESTRTQMLRAAEVRLAETAAQFQAERDAWEAARQEMLHAGEEQRAFLEASLAGSEKRVAECNQRIEVEHARLETLHRDLEEQMRGAESEKAGLAEALGSARARCEELAALLQAERDQRQPAFLEIEEKCRRAEESRAALVAELQAAQGTRDGLTEQLRTRDEAYQSALNELEVQKSEVDRLRQLQRETIVRHQELIRKWSSDFEHALTSTVARCQQEEEERIQKISAQQRAERESLEEQLARARADLQRLAEEAGSAKRSLQAEHETLEKQLARAQAEHQRLAEETGAEKGSLEAELDKLSVRHRNLVDGGLVAYALTTPEGRLLGCNDAFTRILGFESTRNVLTAAPDILKPAVDENGGKGGRLGEHGWVPNIRCRIKRADGRPVVLQGYAGPAPGQKGEPSRLEWFFNDITERYVLEEELRRSRRMEAVGRLATEVAPALNDLLTSVEGLYSRLQGTEAGGAAGRDLADRVAKDTSRAQRLAHQLWMFSQKQDRKPEVFDLNSQLKEQETILRRLTGEDIDLRLRLDPEPQRIALVKQELEQAVTTLVVIARDALPAGGAVTLETGRVQVEGADERWGDTVVPGTYVQLSVSALGLGARAASSTSTLEDIIRRNGGFSRVVRGQESETAIRVFLPYQPGE